MVDDGHKLYLVGTQPKNLLWVLVGQCCLAEVIELV